MTIQANKKHARERKPADDPRISLLRELADPLRLRVVDRLGHGGPATVTRLAGELGVPLPQLSNHLRRLREAGLVAAQREGRQVAYELADPGLELLIPMLDSITGRVEAGATRGRCTGLPSRTCYRHLGGSIGVSLYRILCDRDALRPRADGVVELGPAAIETLARLGVDPSASPVRRQRFAFECLDATERAPHLAGALGDAIAQTLFERGWIKQAQGSRVVSLTPAGRKGLKRSLGVAGIS